MALTFYALDSVDAERGEAGLVLGAPCWERLVRCDVAPYLTVLALWDAEQTLRDAIAAARAEAPEEAVELERFLRAGGSSHIGYEWDGAAQPRRSAVIGPAVVLGEAVQLEVDGPKPDEACQRGAGDGDTLAVARWNGTVEVWDLVTGRRLGGFTPAPGDDGDDANGVDDLAVDAGRGLVAITARYGAVRGVWRLDGHALWTDDRDNGNENHLRFAPSGAVLWWSFELLEVIDATSGQVMVALPSHPAGADGDDEDLDDGDDEQLWLWSGDPARPPRVLGSTGARHACSVLAVVFTADGRRLVSLDRRSVRVWDAATGAPCATFAAGQGDLAGLHVTSTRAWAWSEDGAIYGWSL